jgi:hypothetical protein
MSSAIDALSICTTIKACTYDNSTRRGQAGKQEVEEDLAIGSGALVDRMLDGSRT